MGAVNTIVRRPDGSLIGHNTDYFGFTSMVAKSRLCVSDKKVLVLGSGGASATAVAVLNELGANVVVISRTGENNYSNLHRHVDASVIVNTTPLGMYPDVGVSPLDISVFPQLEGVLDVVYNPSKTQLLLDAEGRGLTAMNGLWMLVAQAKESAEWFSGCSIDDSIIQRIHSTLRRQMENIVLVGMPGCGKSTVGKLLAAETGKTFIDADSEIERLSGKSIPEIFADSGEEGFRVWETKVLADLGRRSGLVIATGGGCVTRSENHPLLHQNGRIYWLKREIDSLPADGRPLSQAGKLQEMYKVRKPLYQLFSDNVVNNNGTVTDTITAIVELEAQV